MAGDGFGRETVGRDAAPGSRRGTNDDYFRAIFESVAQGLVVVDEAGSIELVNAQAEALFGYSRTELIGLSIEELVPEGSRARHAQYRLQYHADPKVRPMGAGRELCGRRKDGTEISLEIALSPLETADGPRVLVSVVSSGARSRLAAIVESSDDAIISKSLDGVVTSWNRGAEALFGYSAQEMIGRPISTIIPVDRIKEESQILDRLRRGERIASFETERVRKDGEVRLVSLTISPVFDGAGRITGASKIVRDITAARRSERALLEHARLAKFVSAAALAIVQEASLADVLRHCAESMVEHLGAAFARIWTVREGETILELQASAGMYTHLDGPHGRVPVGKFKIGLIASERTPHLTNQVIGDPRVSDQAWAKREGMVAFAGYPLVVSGRLVGVMAMFARQPITDPVFQALGSVANSVALVIEKKHAETALIQTNKELRVATEQARAADRLKSAFLATMSHELRTPLNSIIGFTGIILQGLAGPLNAEQTRQLEMVRESSRHLLSLINDVLDLSKIEAGQLEVARAPFDLHASVAKMVGIARPLADKKGLALRVDIAPEVGVVVSDQRRVEQVLLNLLTNAIKFTERGDVTLTADAIGGGSADLPTPTAVRVRITDTGIGIATEDLPKLFRPFRQIDSKLSRGHEGTGLGLAICRRLMDLLGGKIRVESVFAKGSTFEIALPLEGSES